MTVSAAWNILSILVLDGGLAVWIGAAALSLGLWFVRAIGLHREPARFQLLIGGGLGAGALSLGVLGLGVCGALQRTVWMGLLGLLCLLGWPRLDDVVRLFRSGAAGCVDGADDAPDGRGWAGLWLLAIPFAAIALSVATFPPGYLWSDEGNGYDVLEYHFGAPKEYFIAGRIEHLPHNIYSNMPLSAEMLYLLAFVLHGSPWDGVYTAQLVNCGLAFLAVAGAWLAGREFGRRAGVVAGVVVATCPFMTYLCGVAYSENGLLAMTMLAAACVVRGLRGSGPSAARWAMAAGLFAGLACGFKYSAAAMVGVPVVAAWTWLGRHGIVPLVVSGAACAAAFAPWLARNFVNTGNPVFPLVRTVFHERPGVWSDEAAARWEEGHRPDPPDRPLGRRIARAGREIVADWRYGPMVFVLAGIGGVGAMLQRMRHRCNGGVGDVFGAGVVWIIVVAGVWMFATHLVGRFALPMLAPLAVLSAMAGRFAARGWLRALLITAIVMGSAWNARAVYAVVRAHGVFELEAFGRTALMRAGAWPGLGHVAVLNRVMADGGRIAMVGDARAFYVDGRPSYWVVFNRNPMAEAAGGGPVSLRSWLNAEGYTHVYVDWSEMVRLARSRYGFWPQLLGLRGDDWRAAGLEAEEVFRFEGRTYATLFRVVAGD
ncbi:MAG: hypothetical protein L6Q92_08650 [Phycisphaerae bacterium]|nr:hypothetical protein [Phycisphaerae bacterium]